MKLRDAAEYVPARAAAAGLARLPIQLAERIGTAAGHAAWRAGTRRDVVEAQISAAFPDRSAAWIRETTAACYGHFGRETAVMARLGRTGGAVLRGRMLDGDAVVTRYRSMTASGRGALIVTGHLGNWEVAGAFLAAAGLDMAAVVKRQRNPAFDRWLLLTRRRMGIEPVYMEEASARIPELLREGTAVALVADQDAGRRGVLVPFLGRSASTFRGPARLALAHDAPLFFGAAVREGDRYRAILEHVPPPGSPERAEEEMTRRWVARLEDRVRRSPGQYFWFHRRWKSSPVGNSEGSAR